MFRPLADARYWFRTSSVAARRPSSKPTAFGPYGAVILADGTAVELDYTDAADERKLSGLEVAEVVGNGWRDRTTGEWSVSVRGNIHLKHSGAGATLADALRAALDVCYAAEAAEIALRDDAPAHLERELSRHDWWCMMSDSYGTTLAGQQHMEEIRGIIAKVPSATVRALWTKHAPTQFACPV
jgi:hypothetical protein